MIAYLRDNYDLYCYNSKKEHNKEDKLVRMMGSNLMISLFQPNNEIQKKEINTARELNIPILLIYNSEEEKENESVNKEEDKIVLEKVLKRIEIKLKNKFKLIKKIKKRQDLPFRTLENKTELFKFTIINSFSILKEEIQNNKLIKISKDSLLACVDSEAKEIIVLNNNVVSKYDFNFEKISQDKTLPFEDDVVIDVIVVNEENKHLYAISNNSFRLYHLDDEFTIIEETNVAIPLLIKVFKNHLHLLLNGYNNLNIEGEETSQLIEDER